MMEYAPAQERIRQAALGVGGHDQDRPAVGVGLDLEIAEFRDPKPHLVELDQQVVGSIPWRLVEFVHQHQTLRLGLLAENIGNSCLSVNGPSFPASVPSSASRERLLVTSTSAPADSTMARPSAESSTYLASPGRPVEVSSTRAIAASRKRATSSKL